MMLCCQAAVLSAQHHPHQPVCVVWSAGHHLPAAGLAAGAGPGAAAGRGVRPRWRYFLQPSRLGKWASLHLHQLSPRGQDEQSFTNVFSSSVRAYTVSLMLLNRCLLVCLFVVSALGVQAADDTLSAGAIR